MENRATPANAPSLELGDIYYTLFRHKWKIILCTVLGLTAAFVARKLRPAPYQSEAKLFIRYVVTEGKTTGPGKDDTVTKSPDQRGETIISSELQILTSLDLAEEVVKSVGAEKILAGAGGGKDPVEAALLVRAGLTVEVPPYSSVIRISFRHADPAIVQTVLQALIDAYLKKHVEIHRAVGLVGDFLAQETDQLRAQLAQTEEDLRKATNKAGIISLEDSRQSASEQIARLRRDIFDAQAELAQRSSLLQDMTKGSPTPVTATPERESPSSAQPPPDQVAAYQRLIIRLGMLRQREQEYLVFFKEGSSRVQEVRPLIAEIESQKAKLEAEYPALLRIPGPTPVATSSNQNAPAYDPGIEAAKIASLQIRIKVLNAQLDEVRTDAARVDEQGVTIMDLRRRKELQEANYKYFSSSLEQSRINEALGSNRVSNINSIESPTPPAQVWGNEKKLVAALAFGGVASGIAWAFLIELFLDRTVRRPGDIERTLGLPLFLSIPRMRLRRQTKAVAASLKDAPASQSLALSLDTNGMTLNPYYETLRDRLINYFDSMNVRHKPKLVAVTGLGKDTGVTTLAAGLARSFSEIGEGNVLLVDMTQGQGSAQHFHKGTPVGLEQLLDTKDSAQVKENLYVVSENSSSDRLAKGMPQRFNQLIPKLKAADFDYIIFDMPPVNQISITPRLASFMDMMLLVLESEKADRDVALHASTLLSKSKAPVGVVLNKTNSYVPTRLHQDREFLLGT